MQKALSSLTQTEAFKLENWNYPWFFSVSHVKLLFFSFWLKQTRSFQLLIPEQGQCLENWKQMLGQILGVIYWKSIKLFKQQENVQWVNIASMWAKTVISLLWMPVPESSVEKFVETLTFPHEAQMCSKCFLKPCVVR